MLQRRLLYDDFRGVGEPLNETVPVRTTTSFLLTPLSSWAGPVRTRVTQLNNPLMLFFGPPQPDASWLKTYTCVAWSIRSYCYIMRKLDHMECRIMLLDDVFVCVD
jgi:hypothetical protein